MTPREAYSCAATVRKLLEAGERPGTHPPLGSSEAHAWAHTLIPDSQLPELGHSKCSVSCPVCGALSQQLQGFTTM